MVVQAQATTRHPAPLRALVGVVSAAAGVGVSHAVAALTVPAASPLLAVGSVLIDAAPTPVKEWAVATFGTADKPILLAGVGVALLALTAAIGLLAFRSRPIGVAGMAALGVLAAIATALRIPGLLALVPAITAAAVSVAVLLVLHRTLGSTTPIGESDEPATAPEPLPGSPLAGEHVRPGRFVPKRRGVLLGAPLLLAGAGAGAGGGAFLSRLRGSDTALGHGIELPAPQTPADALPSGVHPDIEGLTPFVTDNADFYRVDIALSTPRIEASTWTLPIDGMVDREVTLSYADILAMPLVERWITMSCVSNPVGGPYVSNARWLGVPLAQVLELAGVQQGAEQIFARGADGFSCSVPLDVALDGRDALLAVGMNAEQLPFAHGFPARLIVPGLFGYVSAAKWLTGLTLSTYDRDVAYWTQRGWATDGPVLTQTRIDVPGPLERVPAGDVVIAGMSWAQHRGVQAVEVRIDDGPWEQAELATDAGADLWRSWSYTWPSTGSGRHDITVRTTDRTGQTQPEDRTNPFPDGARGWHSLAFTIAD